VAPIAVGDALVPLLVFLTMPDTFIKIPLDETYQAAWEAVPKRWLQVIEPSSQPS
jgi:hypothetical protein